MATEAPERTNTSKTQLGPDIGKLGRNVERFVVSRFQNNVLLDNPKYYPYYYENLVRRYMQDGEHWPIIFATHKSHPAGFPLMEEALHIANIVNPLLTDEKITGSLILFARSIEKEQNEEVSGYYDLARPTLKKLHAKPVYTVREKDLKPEEEEMKKFIQSKQYDLMLNTVKEGRIPLILPEASVESGRQKEGGAPGEINGMIPLYAKSVKNIVRSLLIQHKKPLLFFIGNTGEDKIYNPNTEKITNQARLLALGLRHERIMSSVIDYPTPIETIFRDLDINPRRIPEGVLEQYCGERLAQLIPENERGVYTTPTLLDRVDTRRWGNSHVLSGKP